MSSQSCAEEPGDEGTLFVVKINNVLKDLAILTQNERFK